MYLINVYFMYLINMLCFHVPFTCWLIVKPITISEIFDNYS